MPQSTIHRGAAMGANWRLSRRSLIWAAASAVFGFVVLWVSGFEPLEWWRVHESAVVAQAASKPKPAPSLPISIVQPTPMGTDSSVSPAPLALHLMATRLGRNSREGYADIGVDVRSLQTYRAGAVLANGARLYEIYADHVVLALNDRSVNLYVEGTPESLYPRTTQELSARSALTVGGRPKVELAQADSPDPLSAIMRISPIFDGDRVQALELYPGGRAGGSISITRAGVGRSHRGHRG